MKTVLLLSVLFIFLPLMVYPQHLPHKIDNQWHYDCSSLPGMPDYVAVATERVLVTGTYYWKIDRYEAQTGAYLETVYDRTEGDSLYIRKVACPEELLINFDWPLGYIEVNAIGNDCYELRKLVSRYSRDVFGVTTLSYKFSTGLFCEGYADTVWDQFQPEITKEFGCYWGGDGRIVGAVLNGVTYGTLYPLPVEMTSFTAAQIDEKGIQLSWRTASETNNSGFEITRKLFGTSGSWENIAFVPGRGTTSQSQNYSYKDDNIKPGTWAYRITQFDFNGSQKLVGETACEFILSPDLIKLGQNYPNPFNPSTNISYSVPVESDIRIIVYDLLGREISELVHQNHKPGNYTIEWNAAQYPSGIYLYRITASAQNNQYFSALKKMILLK